MGNLVIISTKIVVTIAVVAKTEIVEIVMM